MDPENEEVQTPETPEVQEAPEAPESGFILEDAPDLTAEEVFQFDPFGPDGTPDIPESERVDPETGEQLAGTGREATPEPSPVPQPEGEAGVQSGVASATPPAQEQIDWQARAQAAEQQTQQILEFLRNTQQQQVPKEPEKPKEPELPNYGFQIPEQIQAMLTSDDPNDQSRGLAALISGMAQTVHTNLRKEYGETLNREISQFRERFIQDRQRAEQASQVYNDFYSTYPQLNRPELRGLIQAASKAVVAEEGATQWSVGLRDKIAKKAFEIISSTVGQSNAPTADPAAAPATPAAGQKTGNGAQRQVPRPPRMRGTTAARPASEGQPAPGSQEAHMEDVLHRSWE